MRRGQKRENILLPLKFSYNKNIFARSVAQLVAAPAPPL